MDTVTQRRDGRPDPGKEERHFFRNKKDSKGAL